MSHLSSGRTSGQGDGESSETTVASDATPLISAQTIQPELLHKPETDEDALETHEVIELQTFIERKAWIEEKIKFLEQMPPVEVFIGLDAIRSSAEDVPGLPTRAELQQWIMEHDAIEKDTEILDAGELKKLRALTKAATQRNLSSHDTDLIELTLTTIYELDKLLHLLRDRSENLDLLTIRLTWEENRIASWRDRRQIISDLQTFLADRARWSASVYETPVEKSEPVANANVQRRGSIASLRSVSSISSDASLSSPGFSRSNRFKLAELLSRDAAQFSSRITSFRHGTIAAAGRTLDKLIDASRKPVPDELLDEQDKLEEEGINGMENLGKFIMTVIMQWRKADELYVETLKDQLAIRGLIDEAEGAKLGHPTGKLINSFASRFEALKKRLLIRGIPTAPGSMFPNPLHPLFPEQDEFNKSLSQLLATEIETARDLLKNAEPLIREYCSNYEAVKNIETLVRSAEDAVQKLESVTERLGGGVQSTEGDGSPPDLTTSDCLSPTSHSVFLALLPSILDEQRKGDDTASHILRSMPSALLRLDFSGCDPQFQSHASVMAQRLEQARDRACRIRDDTTARAARLREARKVWASLERNSKLLEDMQIDIGEAMDRHRWKQEAHNTGVPLTPESPPAVLLSPVSAPLSLPVQLGDLQQKLADEVEKPLSSLQTLEVPLRQYLAQCTLDMKKQLEHTAQMLQLLDSIRSQASAMAAIRNEFNDLQMRVENISVRLDSVFVDTMNASADDDQNELHSLVINIRADIAHFNDQLHHRVPLVGSTNSASARFVKKRFRTSDSKMISQSAQEPIEIPFELHTVNDAVRSDANMFAMRLNGGLGVLEQKLNKVDIGRRAKEIDRALAAAIQAINRGLSTSASLKTALSDIKPSSSASKLLHQLSQDATHAFELHRAEISRSFSPAKELLREMGCAPGVSDPSIHGPIYLTRIRSLDDAELKFKTWSDDATKLLGEISESIQQELRRLDEMRAAEEAEKARLERERVAAEERERLEQERMDEEKRKQEAERARVENQLLQIEQDRLAEEDRIATERCLQDERERLAAVEVEERCLLQGKTGEDEQDLLQTKASPGRPRPAEGPEQTGDGMAEGTRTDDRQSKDEEQKHSEERVAVERLQQETGCHVENEPGLLVHDASTSRGLQFEEKAELPNSNASLPVEEELAKRIAPSLTLRSSAVNDMHALILRLKKRLQSLTLSDHANSDFSTIPDVHFFQEVSHDLSVICEEASTLPAVIPDPAVDTDIRSLRDELRQAQECLPRIELLASFSTAVHLCDSSLSDLLDHIDNYPILPVTTSTSSFEVDTTASPAEQLQARLSFTRDLANAVSSFSLDDVRVVREKERIVQTWVELEEMSNDRLSGRKSRPSSAMNSDHSSGRDSKSLYINARPHQEKKSSRYTGLSRGNLNVPATPVSRRAVSGSDKPLDRSMTSSRMSTRSASGPTTASLYGSTYASRQRTTSLTQAPPRSTPVKRPGVPKKRSASPSISTASSYGARSSSSMSTWSRAPRISFPGVPRVETPQRRLPPPPRKTYVANPKSKLDVAVGDVVNSLPAGLDINIESVSGSWQDQSGKYWIGDQDPKLCFCRILRSRTVMVRVGGGWTELSKFIRGHCADSFRLLEENTLPSKEERWISSSTLSEAAEGTENPPVPPRTPEPKVSLPSFSISTPSGKSPHSLKSTSSSSGGSPLTALQFLRRAESPSPAKSLRHRQLSGATPARNSVWRP